MSRFLSLKHRGQTSTHVIVTLHVHDILHFPGSLSTAAKKKIRVVWTRGKQSGTTSLASIHNNVCVFQEKFSFKSHLYAAKTASGSASSTAAAAAVDSPARARAMKKMLHFNFLCSDTSFAFTNIDIGSLALDFDHKLELPVTAKTIPSWMRNRAEKSESWGWLGMTPILRIRVRMEARRRRGIRHLSGRAPGLDPSSSKMLIRSQSTEDSRFNSNSYSYVNGEEEGHGQGQEEESVDIVYESDDDYDDDYESESVVSHSISIAAGSVNALNMGECDYDYNYNDGLSDDDEHLNFRNLRRNSPRRRSVDGYGSTSVNVGSGSYFNHHHQHHARSPIPLPLPHSVSNVEPSSTSTRISTEPSTSNTTTAKNRSNADIIRGAMMMMSMSMEEQEQEQNPDESEHSHSHSPPAPARACAWKRPVSANVKSRRRTHRRSVSADVANISSSRFIAELEVPPPPTTAAATATGASKVECEGDSSIGDQVQATTQIRAMPLPSPLPLPKIIQPSAGSSVKSKEKEKGKGKGKMLSKLRGGSRSETRHGRSSSVTVVPGRDREREREKRRAGVGGVGVGASPFHFHSTSNRSLSPSHTQTSLSPSPLHSHSRTASPSEALRSDMLARERRDVERLVISGGVTSFSFTSSSSHSFPKYPVSACLLFLTMMRIEVFSGNGFIEEVLDSIQYMVNENCEKGKGKGMGNFQDFLAFSAYWTMNMCVLSRLLSRAARKIDKGECVSVGNRNGENIVIYEPEPETTNDLAIINTQQMKRTCEELDRRAKSLFSTMASRVVSHVVPLVLPWLFDTDQGIVMENSHGHHDHNQSKDHDDLISFVKMVKKSLVESGLSARLRGVNVILSNVLKCVSNEAMDHLTKPGRVLGMAMGFNLKMQIVNLIESIAIEGDTSLNPIREIADVLILPKDVIWQERREICPSLSDDLIKCVFSNYLPDDLDPAGLPKAMEELLSSSRSLLSESASKNTHTHTYSYDYDFDFHEKDYEDDDIPWRDVWCSPSIADTVRSRLKYLRPFDSVL